MLTGDPLSEETLLTFVAEDIARLSMKRIRHVLMALDVYSPDQLDDPYELGGLSEYDLVVEAIREKGSWDLLPAFHKVRRFTPQTLAALEAEGIRLGGPEEQSPPDDHDAEAESLDEDGEVLPDVSDELPNVPLEVLTRRVLFSAASIAGVIEWIGSVRDKFGPIWWLLGRIGCGLTALAAFLAILSFYAVRLTPPKPTATAAPVASLVTSSSPTGTSLPTDTPEPTKPPTATQVPLPSSATAAPTTQSPADSPGSIPCRANLTDPGTPKVSISEIMFIPQPPFGNRVIEGYNEYVELFNYGESPADVAGWWISDGGIAGKPDSLIAWGERMAGIPVGEANTGTTIIPAGGYALIIPIKYDDGDKPYSAQIPSEAVILTLADHLDSDNEVIGKDGLAATGVPLDVLLLYRGTESMVDVPISTYGTPTCDEAGTAASIRDDGKDAIPKEITSGWGGYRRIHLNGIDTLSNWEQFSWEARTPGY